MVSRYYPSSDPVACHQCFADEQLVTWIKGHGTRGRCGWCEARNAYVVDLPSLGKLFEQVTALYSPSDSVHGDYLSDLLQEDWEVFSEQILEKDLAKPLIEAIMTAGVDPGELMSMDVDYRGLFHRQELYSFSLEEEWESTVASELFGKKVDAATSERGADLDRTSFAIEDVGTTYPSQKALYRARLYKDRSRTGWYTLGEMGAPSPEKATAARANREEQPVLYMASDLQTALAEVRAWKGAPVTIAEMKTVSTLRILDLSKPYTIASPFFQEEENPLSWKIEASGLLNRFGEELSRPVMPHEEATLYLPTQHLCDLVRAAGFNGIAYPSAMGPGHNVVFFDPSTVAPSSLSHHRVKEPNFKSTTPSPYEPPYQKIPWTR